MNKTGIVIIKTKDGLKEISASRKSSKDIEQWIMKMLNNPNAVRGWNADGTFAVGYWDRESDLRKDMNDC